MTIRAARGFSSSRSPRIFVQPSDSIDETVDRWLAIAEETMFEWPPDTGPINSFDAAYIELGTSQTGSTMVVYDS